MRILALSSDADATLAQGRQLAAQGAGHCVVHVAIDPAGAAHRACLRADVADPAAVAGVADGGLYEIRERHVRRRRVDWPTGTVSPGVAAVYTTRRRAGLSHAEYDRHWSEVHGPLALEHHVGMCDYWQCAIEAPLTDGSPDFDGLAIVTFPSAWSLEHEFYGGPESRRIIGRDAASFTDLERLARVHMQEWILSPEP